MDLKEALYAEQKQDTTETASLLSTLSLPALERKGLAVLNLTVDSASSSLGGRTILQLVPDKAISSILPLNLKAGDIVSLQPQKGRSPSQNGQEATVVRAGTQQINIAFESEEVDILDGRVCLLKLVNTVTYKRMHWALDKIKDADTRLSRLINGGQKPTIGKLQAHIFDLSLNASQIEAVEYALGSEVSVIHGPPGTGKTSTVVEIARQLAQKGERILICGPSNVSVDNVIERLSPHFKSTQLIRLGHPARLSDTVLKHSLDLVSKTCDSGQIVRELRSEIDGLLAKAKKTRSRSERKGIYANVKDLRKDLRVREKTVVRELVLGARIIVSTLHTAGSTILNEVPKPLFNSIIIDEVSQALIPQCMIPLVVEPSAERIVIAGDNKQLPPTIVSNEAGIKKTLERTLFDVFVENFGDTVKHLLDTQYRFNREIMEFPSKSMYEGKLKVEEPIGSQRLCDLEHVQQSADTEAAIVWIDTEGGLYQEQNDEESFSTRNEGEGELVRKYVEKLRENGVKLSDIGVITPYSAQVSFIKQLLDRQVEVATVDGFQGREKQVIVMSMVRSNDSGNVGFVSDERRINVAITRPKRHLCIIGDSETIGSTGYLKRWVEWCQENVDTIFPDSIM